VRVGLPRQACPFFEAYWPGDPRDDNPRRQTPGPYSDGRRWAGDVRQHGAQAERKKDSPPVQRLHPGRFSGSAADSFALFSRFESKLEQYRGNLERAAVELARDWRTDRLLRRLEAMLIVSDKKSTFLLSGTGDLIEPDDGIVAVGSGGPFAMAAARALARHSPLDARHIAVEAMAIAADICIYTNPNLTIEELWETGHGVTETRSTDMIAPCRRVSVAFRSQRRIEWQSSYRNAQPPRPDRW